MAVHVGFPIVTSLIDSSITATAAELNVLASVTAGTAAASKAVVLDANADVTGQRHITMSGSLINSNTNGATMKGIYVSGTVAVAVPTIANDTAENGDSVDVDVSSLTFAPAVGDAVFAIPLEALPTDCLFAGAWVSATDTVQVSFVSKEAGGGVTGANKNFKFIFFDLT